MLKIVLLFLAVVPGSFASSTQQASPAAVDFSSSGNDFLRVCEQPLSEKGYFLDGACRAYIVGVSDGIAMMQKDAPLFCVPLDVDNNQKYSVVVKYLKDHPEKTHLQARRLILEATVNAFPCAKGR